jgi:hypothetical protein
MFISSRCKSGLFCFLYLLFNAISTIDGQLGDDSPAITNGQQNNKVNSIKVNKIVTSVEQPADSDRVVYNKKYSSLNSKYVTQSTVTSDPYAGINQGSKKSEYKRRLNEEENQEANHSNWHQLTSIVLTQLLTCLKQLTAGNVLECV